MIVSETRDAFCEVEPSDKIEIEQLSAATGRILNDYLYLSRVYASLFTEHSVVCCSLDER